MFIYFFSLCECGNVFECDFGYTVISLAIFGNLQSELFFQARDKNRG